MDALLGSLELEDPSDWPSAFPHLREIDQLLRCPVCKEYFETAMITGGCGHTFCSLCVRRCLTQETKCPSCRTPLTESELRPNRLVDSLMKSFRGGRQNLLGKLSLTMIDGGMTKTGKKEITRKRRRMHTRATTSMDAGPASSDADFVLASNNETTAFTDSNAGEGGDPGAEVDGEYTDSDSDQMSHPYSKDASVKCPNCQQLVPQSYINKHLDRCLYSRSNNVDITTGTVESQTSKKSLLSPMLRLQPAKTSFVLPRPTKLAYNLISESKLRRTLKELGIPFKGDKSQMQARHVEWVNVYMANADSATPVSHRTLLKRLAAWEESMSRQPDNSRNNHHQQQLHQQSSSSQSSATDHAAKYADSFAQLITQASISRARKG